ncbi:MAG: hypothetical protein J6A38_00540 [Clostridia bacterium]|nr:hypothetical protein [Clostridia bacterium]
MELLSERQETRVNSATAEAQAHNAQIRERYRKLQDAEATQFAESAQRVETQQTPVSERPFVYTAPVLDEVSTVEQTPVVTEFVHERIEAPVFTTERFERVEEKQVMVENVQPTYVAPVRATAVSTQAQYSLTPFAKMVMAAFTLIVVAMLTMICINTQIIRQKSVRLKNLEEQRQELVERNERIQRDIENATSEDTIREYAASQGW